MKAADECRKLAQQYQTQADQPGVSPLMSAALRRISHSSAHWPVNSISCWPSLKRSASDKLARRLTGRFLMLSDATRKNCDPEMTGRCRAPGVRHLYSQYLGFNLARAIGEHARTSGNPRATVCVVTIGQGPSKRVMCRRYAASRFEWNAASERGFGCDAIACSAKSFDLIRTCEMTSTLLIALTVFVILLAGAFVGAKIKDHLPKDHLTDDTKSLVNVSTAVIATVSALVLGLLISNANTSFTRLGGEVTALSAQILRLDHMLRRYGAGAAPARSMLLQYAKQKSTDLFPQKASDAHIGNPATYELLQRVEDMLLELKPNNSRDQWWLGQAMILAGKIGDTRWLIAQHVGQSTPKAFIALLVFWLALLFASFGLFAPPNLTSTVTLTLCALAVAAAVGMILELEHGFGGHVRISPDAMGQAVRTLEARPNN